MSGNRPAVLVLEDGRVFTGTAFGAHRPYHWLVS